MSRTPKPPVPDFCGFQCPHSAFPPADTAGICRTMAAVHCKKLNKLVSKNRPCAWRAKGKAKGRAPGK